MNYTVEIEGFEGQNIEVTVGFWSGPKLLVNGEVTPKGNKRGEMVLQRNDSKQVTAVWKPQVLGLDVPQLLIDGKEYNLVEPLKWYQWVWGGLPVILVFMGGALGAIAGMIAFSANAKVFRMEMNGLLKYIVSGAISILAIVAYYIVAVALSQLFNG